MLVKEVGMHDGGEKMNGRGQDYTFPEDPTIQVPSRPRVGIKCPDAACATCHIKTPLRGACWRTWGRPSRMDMSGIY